jgi:hypothetical protein
MLTATIIGSGPNGLSAAIVLAFAGIDTTGLERNSLLGGAVRIGGAVQRRDHVAGFSMRFGIIRISDGIREPLLPLVACCLSLDCASRSVRTSS